MQLGLIGVVASLGQGMPCHNEATTTALLFCAYCSSINSYEIPLRLLAFAALSLGLAPLGAQTLPPNMLADTTHAPFLHGVASFDPTPDHAIIWTKVDPGPSSAPITLNLGAVCGCRTHATDFHRYGHRRPTDRLDSQIRSESAESGVHFIGTGGGTCREI